jgi:diguanylate cyclase (GGDEF)-like protein/PAS domain S-box-containing protein
VGIQRGGSAEMMLIEGHARELLDAAPDAMIIADSSGRILYANWQTEALFGYSDGELIGKPVEMLLPERFRKHHPSLRASYARNPRLRSMSENAELYAQHRNGSEFRVEIRLSALQTEEGLLISSTIRDITARGDLLLKANLLIQNSRATVGRPGQANELVEASERAQGTLNSIGDAVISTDRAGNVSYLNLAAEKLTGWSLADARGRPLKDVLTITNDSESEPMLALQSAPVEVGVASTSASGILTRRDGAEFAVEHSAAPMQDDRGAVIGAVMVFRDVSAARAITQKLAYAAHHDALTGLANRLLFESRLTQGMALARRHNCEVAVLFLDLDRFKPVNDAWGHLVGDRLLQSVADLLQRCVRNTDTVSRFGGDEFVVLLSEISKPADAVALAEKILHALRIPHTIDQHSLLVTASIGIGLYPHDGIDPQTLLRNADDAMFRAKRAGGNAYRLSSRSVEYQ